MFIRRKKFSRFLDTLEARWNLWNLFWAVIQGSSLVASAALPAWAVHAGEIFSQYAPFSWVVAGFAGLLVWAVIYLIVAWAYRLKVRAKYDERFIERGESFNPLDSTFERRRIHINDFVLPSHPYVDGKTFIDCDIIGPANIYFSHGNQAHPVKPPIVDAICLDPRKNFNTGFVFSNCIFRNCSFQRISIFVSVETYVYWLGNNNVNWIGIPPTDADIDIRQQQIDDATQKAGLALPARIPKEPKQIEHKDTSDA